MIYKTETSKMGKCQEKNWNGVDDKLKQINDSLPQQEEYNPNQEEGMVPTFGDGKYHAFHMKILDQVKFVFGKFLRDLYYLRQQDALDGNSGWFSLQIINRNSMMGQWRLNPSAHFVCLTPRCFPLKLGPVFEWTGYLCSR